MSASPTNQEESLEVIRAPYKDASCSGLISTVSGTVCPIGSQALSVLPPPPHPLTNAGGKWWWLYVHYLSLYLVGWWRFILHLLTFFLHLTLIQYKDKSPVSTSIKKGSPVRKREEEDSGAVSGRWKEKRLSFSSPLPPHHWLVFHKH